MEPSFKQFLQSYGKKYIELALSEESQSKLRKWCMDKGFNIKKNYNGTPIDPEQFHFHITIFYSDNKKYVANGSFQLEEPIQITFSRPVLFGEKKDVPVFLVNKTPELVNIRKIYENMGLTDSWGDWKPHVSISYAYNGKPEISTLKMPDFDLYVDKIKIENQKEK